MGKRTTDGACVERTMQRRKFLLGAGSLAAAGAAATGTGAVNYFQADRSMNVSTASDSNAFIQLVSTSPYATESSNGTLELNFNQNSNVGGEGLNKNADSRIDGVFEIRNRGGSGMGFWIDDGGSSAVEFFEEKDSSYPTMESSGTAIPVGPGESVGVTIAFLLRENSFSDVPNEITIGADESQYP